MAENSFSASYAPTGRASCKYKICGEKIEKDQLRLRKDHPSPFRDGMQTDFYHAECIFKSFANARKDTKLLDDESLIQGFDELMPSDQDLVRDLIKEFTSGELTSKAKEEFKEARAKKKDEKDVDLDAKPPEPKRKRESDEEDEKEAAPAKKKFKQFEPIKKDEPSLTPSKPATSPIDLRAHPYLKSLPLSWQIAVGPRLIKVEGLAEAIDGDAAKWEPFRGIEPDSVRAVVLEDESNETGLPFVSDPNENLSSASSSALAPFLAQVRKAYPTNLISGSANGWMKHLVSQGLLFVPLRGLPLSDQEETYDAMALAVVEGLIEALRNSSVNHAFAVILMGPRAQALQPKIDGLKMEFSDEVTLAVMSLPSPFDPAFTSRAKNPIREIDDAILSVNHAPIKWAFSSSASPSKSKAGLKVEIVGCDNDTDGLRLEVEEDKPIDFGRNSFEKLKSAKSISRHQVTLTALREGGKPGLKVSLMGSNPLIYTKDGNDEGLEDKAEVILFDGDKFCLVADTFQFQVQASETKTEVKSSSKSPEEIAKEIAKETIKAREKLKEEEREKRQREADKHKELEKEKEREREKEKERELKEKQRKEKEAKDKKESEERERQRQKEKEKEKSEENKASDKEGEVKVEEEKKSESDRNLQVPVNTKKRVLPWLKDGPKKSPAKRARKNSDDEEKPKPKSRAKPKPKANKDSEDEADFFADDFAPKKATGPRRAATKKINYNVDEEGSEEEKEEKPKKAEKKEEKKEKVKPDEDGFVDWDQVGKDLGKPKKKVKKGEGEESDFEGKSEESSESTGWIKDAAPDKEESEEEDEVKSVTKNAVAKTKDSQDKSNESEEEEKEPKKKRRQKDSDEDSEMDDFIVDDDDEDAVKKAPSTTRSGRVSTPPKLASQSSTTGKANPKGVALPVCKYGKKCYRKNPDHFVEFAHPWLSE